MAEPQNTTMEEQRILARIEERRSRMGATIEEIGAHLNPGHLRQELRDGAREQVQQVKHDIREATIGRVEAAINNVEDSVNRTSRSLIDTIRDNPVPAAMAGIGIGWLIADSRRHSGHDAFGGGRERDSHGVASTAPGYVGAYGYTAPPMDYPPTGRTRTSEDAEFAGRARNTTHERGDDLRQTADRAREAVSEGIDQLGDAADRAGERVSQAARSAQHRAGEMIDRTQHTVQDAWHGTEDRAHRMQHQAQRLTDENPLAAGAVALALGFAAGMMIPETRPEHRLMGPTRDRLLDDAEDVASRAVERVGHAAQDAVEEARHAGEREARDLMGDDTGSPRTL